MAHTRANVLLVDDRPENLLALKGVLEAPDRNIVLAGSGNEALARVLEQPFACILLDVEMPNLSGLEVAEILRDDPVFRAIPIILTTAHRKDDLDVFRGYEFGAVDYLIKPFEPAVVRGKVAVFAELFRKQSTITQLNRALRTANEDLRQFTKVAAHDLKEPARLVATFCQLAEQTLKGEANPRASESLAVAIQGARRLCSLLDDLVSLINVRDSASQRELLDLNRLVDDVLAENRLQIESALAKIVVESLPVVHGNRAELKVVISSLLSNAIKFRVGQPLKITFAGKRTNGEVVVSVTDTSQGIDKEYCARIFELFNRTSGESEKLGNGLGLALCRQIVEKHGGRIWVESLIGSGSTFFFALPAYDPATESPVSTAR